jgi:hypothetical protein
VVLAAAAALPVTRAAQNVGTGDIAGVPGDLTDSPPFDLSTTTLGLVKRAYLSDGTPLTSGTSVPRGTVVKFMIYLNNNTGVPVNDVSIQDALVGATFDYQLNTIKMDNAVAACALAACTGAEEAAIFASVDAVVGDCLGSGANCTDAVDGDVVSYTAATTTIDAGDQNVANATLNANANSVLAMLFTITMQ